MSVSLRLISSERFLNLWPQRSHVIQADFGQCESLNQPSVSLYHFSGWNSHVIPWFFTWSVSDNCFDCFIFCWANHILILTVFVFQAFTHTCVCDSETIVAVDLRDIVAFSIPWAATQLRFISFLLILINVTRTVSEEQLIKFARLLLVRQVGVAISL